MTGRHTGRWIGIALLCAALDQGTKAAIEAWLPLHGAVSLTSFFNIVHVLNRGAAFSFLADQPGWQRLFFGAIAVIACIVLTVLIARKPRTIEAAAYALILGGAVGNLIDRIFRGAVVDWLDFYWNAYHWPAFNFADICIVVGAGLYLFANLRADKDSK